MKKVNRIIFALLLALNLIGWVATHLIHQAEANQTLSGLG